MKFVLWIDDEPYRWSLLFPEGDRALFSEVIVFFAHGYEQINHYLNASGIPFDLIIVDHDMPKMDGMAVCAEFLFEKEIPVVLCSANDNGRGNQLSFLRQYDDDEYKYPVHDISVIREDFKDRVLELLFHTLT